MAYPLGVNFCRVQLFAKGNSKTWSNIFWYTTLSAFGGSWNIASAAAAFEAALVTALADGMEATINYVGSNFLVHNAGLARSIDTYTVTPGNVSATAVPLPDDLAVVVSRLTTTPGKSGRGRLYFAGIPSTHVTENRLNATGISAWNGIKPVLKAAVNDQSMVWSPANFTKKLVAFHAATDFIPEPVLGTQRHRKTRR